MVQPCGQEGRLNLFFRVSVEQLGAVQFAASASRSVLNVGVLEEVTDGDGTRDKGEADQGPRTAFADDDGEGQ